MLKSFAKDNFKITVYGTLENPYFKAKEIATLLGYKRHTKVQLLDMSNLKISLLLTNLRGLGKRTPLQKNDPLKNRSANNISSMNPVCIR